MLLQSQNLSNLSSERTRNHYKLGEDLQRIERGDPASEELEVVKRLLKLIHLRAGEVGGPEEYHRVRDEQLEAA